MALRLLFIAILAFCWIASSGQTRNNNSSQNDTLKVDTVKNRFLPTGIRIGTDVISIIKSQRQQNFSGWEMNGDIDFNRYLLAMEYGKWSRDFPGDSASYINDGTYWRVGVDANFLTKDPERNVFFIGFRYARSSYSESMSLIGRDTIWGDFQREYVNEDMSARWLELTTGLKVKIWKFIWLGYTARFKFGLKDQDGFEMLSHDIPGYGRTNKDTYWGFNYQLMIRFPIRSAPVVVPGTKGK
jgi:hypothetical protein